MVVDFTVINREMTILCAITTAAMDDLEGTRNLKSDQRVDQFVRLRDAIEERASPKFLERPAEAKGPVVLRSDDFLSCLFHERDIERVLLGQRADLRLLHEWG